MAAEITCTGVMHLKDGRVVPLEDLTDEERERCKKSMTERLGRVMSEYYSLHPDKYELLCKSLDAQKGKGS